MVCSRGTVRAVAILVVLLAVLVASPLGQARAGGTPTTALGPTVVGTDAWVSAEAEYLSGRKLTVMCAATAQEWAQALVAVGYPADAAEQYYGFSLIGRGEMLLSPYVCEGLRLGSRVSTRRQNELQVAWSVNVLVHESVHMARSTTDEALTEACARTGLPGELHRLYNVAYRSAELSRLTLAATWFRRTQGPAYQRGSCPTVS
jgi:hypothetical protein